MKKTILILAVTLLSTIGMAQKYGHLNAQDVLKDMPEYKQAEDEIERYGQQKQKELMTMQQTLQTEYQKLMEDVKAGTITPAVQQSREKDLMEMQASVQEAAKKAEEKLAQKEMDLLKPMLEKVQKAIKNVGKDNGFTYIFDTSAGSVVYFDGGNDVTELVKKEIVKLTEEEAKAAAAAGTGGN